MTAADDSAREDALLDEAEALWGEGRDAEALRTLSALGPDHPRAAALEAVLRFEAGSLARGEQALAIACQGLPSDDWERRYAEGIHALVTWRADDARRTLEALRAAGDSPGLLRCLSLAADLQGDWAAGDRFLAAYRRAALPASPALVRLDPDELGALVVGLARDLEPAIRDALETTAVIVDPMPSAALLPPTPEDALGPDVLGLFCGPSELQRDPGAPHEPRRIYLFQRNLEREAASREDVFEEARVTLLHELGHALGFDELGVDELGLG